MKVASRGTTGRIWVRTVSIAVITLAAFLLAVLARREPPDPAGPDGRGDLERTETGSELFLHCGNSMRPAAEALAAEFEKRYGIRVRLNFGGSAELLSSLALGRTGDLYLPHDPYAERLAEEQLLDRYEVVGRLEPVIVVPRGNPHGIEDLRDLASRDLRLALPDPRYSTAGAAIRNAFEELGLWEAVQANVRMEGRGHNDVALALLGGHVDAALVWNFISAFYEDRLDRVSPGVAFPETRVTLCLLTTARNREAAEKFLELAVSDFGRGLFEEHGYTVP